MAAAYAWADLVVCRAGALTVAELAIMGRPAILVPLPHAIDDHQTANARSLTERGGAILLRQSEMMRRLWSSCCRAIWRTRSACRNGGCRAAAATPDAAQRVSDCCEELMHA